MLGGANVGTNTTKKQLPKVHSYMDSSTGPWHDFLQEMHMYKRTRNQTVMHLCWEVNGFDTWWDVFLQVFTWVVAVREMESHLCMQHPRAVWCPLTIIHPEIHSMIVLICISNPLVSRLDTKKQKSLIDWRCTPNDKEWIIICRRTNNYTSDIQVLIHLDRLALKPNVLHLKVQQLAPTQCFCSSLKQSKGKMDTKRVVSETCCGQNCSFHTCEPQTLSSKYVQWAKLLI
jgi:hypothetical protein